jgi:Ras-related C3 botulinum toxin substrate 1
MTSVKIVMVGDGSTGKTCSLIAFTSNEFPMLYVPTVFGEYSANMHVRGVPITLSLWDTAGQEEYDRLRPLSYPQTDIFLLCFAVNSRSTFDNIESKWIPELRKHEPNVPVVLVATKIDSRHTSDHGYVEMVQPEEGAHLCERLNLQGYLEISAKAGVGLQELFDVAVLVGLEARTPHSSRRRCVIQ